MKSHLAFLFAVSLTALQAQTPYHPLLVQGRTWDVFDTPAEPEVCPYTAAYQFFIGGDTLLNGVSYKKVLRHPILSSVPFPFCGWFYLDTSVIYQNGFFLREDTLARKVYLLAPDNPDESVLFDFSLQAGDTLKYPDGLEYPVRELGDFVLTNGDVRKQFIFDDGLGFSNAYIEGIGYTYGPFNRVYYPFEGWEITTCVRDGGEELYNNVEECMHPPYPYEFAPVGAVWYYAQPILETPVKYSFTTIEVTGDTLLNGDTWRVLQGSNNALCGMDTGYILQHNDQVFFRDASGWSYLLYDFGLKPGDSYTTWAGNNIQVQVTVDSVGTTTSGGEILKTWFIHSDPPFWGDRIVEKAGNLDYLVPLYDACDPLPGPIRCYLDNDDYFKWVNYPCDSTFTLSSAAPPVFSSLKILPNPFHTRLNLAFPENTGMPSFLFELYDLTGRLVFRQEIPEGTKFRTLDLPVLPAGMYVWAAGGRLGGRLVKE